MYVDPFSMANERPWMVDNACMAALGCKGESFIEAVEDMERRPQGSAGIFRPSSQKTSSTVFRTALLGNPGIPTGERNFSILSVYRRWRLCANAAKASGSLQDYIAIELAAMSVGMKAC